MASRTPPLFTYQSSVRTSLKMTNCDQFRTNYDVQIGETLTLCSYHRYLFDKNVTIMLHQEGNLYVLFKKNLENLIGISLKKGNAILNMKIASAGIRITDP